jgi:hypothetical protein
VYPLSFIIILCTFVIAGTFWRLQQQANVGVHYRGRPTKRYAQEIKQLKRDGNRQLLQSRLLELINASESQDAHLGDGVCPWYYAQLATSYREGEHFVDELKTLQRFANQKHPSHPEVDELKNRLNTARTEAARRARSHIQQELAERGISAAFQPS